MASSYPGILDNWATNHSDNIYEPVHAEDINNLADAVNKIEAALGTNPNVSAALDPGWGFYKLSASAAASATTITVDRAPGVLSSGAGHYVIIDAFTTNAELRLITGVSGSTLTVGALTYSHSAQASVYFACFHSQGRLIPWSWWGGQGGGDATDATTNTTAFNRLLGVGGQSYNNDSYFGLFIDGVYYVNDQLKMERSLTLRGTNPLQSAIIATNTGHTFPFDTTGAVSIIHAYRDGSPVLYEAAGPSGRWFMSDFSLNGNALSNSCGILTSPQQPDSLKDIRITDCPGLYGLALQDVQYEYLHNMQFNNCNQGLYMWGCEYVRIYNMNNTGEGTTGAIKMVDVADCSVFGALLETVQTGGKIINVTGSCGRLGLYDIFTSGFTGGSTGDVFYFGSSNKMSYTITNALCAQNSATINFVNDVQRGITFNTFGDTNRNLTFMWAQDDLYHYVLGGLGKVVTAGDWAHVGSKVGFNGSAPVSKPTVTGSRGANAALASLLTALASEGLITDSST